MKKAGDVILRHIVLIRQTYLQSFTILSYAELRPEIQKPSCETTDRVVIMYMSLAIRHPALKLVSLNFHERIYLSLFSLNFRLISWTSAVS